jgi:uncharacterized protein (TIGR02246 family)
MKSFRKLLVLAVSIAALAACGKSMAPAVTDTVHKAAIDALEAAFYQAYNAGDGAAMAALYAEDAVLNAPGIPALRGRAAIGDFYAKDAAEAVTKGLTEGDGPAIEVGVSGDFAWRWGTYVITDKSGAPVNAGKYVTLFQRNGGKWMIFRDTWNSDAPIAAAAAPASAAAPK